ncbi:MAG: hypothetical protein ABJG88_01190 [Litorimonas sp.]
MNDPILNIIQSETMDPPARVIELMNIIRTRHENRIQAFIYYGSSLRELDNPKKMLDFYVLVDSYRKTHKNPIRAWLNKLIPPAVYYLEHIDKDNILSTCKYSIISLPEFEKKCGKAAFLSQVWGRFSQPCILLGARSEAEQNRIFKARVKAVKYMASQTAPLIDAPVSAAEFWGRGFYESYRTEIRPESSVGRSAEIVSTFESRYAALTTALYGEPNENGLYTISQSSQSACKRKWLLRRIVGKPVAAIRIINSAATFDGGLDYILRKIKNHSGVSLEPTKFQRKHSVLCSPVLAWKLWRMGAFK